MAVNAGRGGRVSPLVMLMALALLPMAMLYAQQPESCIECHRRENPGIVAQWESSGHGGAGVGCELCHGAQAGEPDAFEHYGETIAAIVSPRDCENCHAEEVEQQQGSHHAKAGEILGSLDNLLGEVVGGPAAVVTGCRQCHGSLVKVDQRGRPTADTWPNTGMGRINPDGSRGSCTACHTRHQFSRAQARQPEGCGKCHLGPDHPQIEVWNESKHGVLYHAFREQLQLDSPIWRAGKEYFTGPTCASCHMSAGGGQATTHDVGARISWTLRPPISTKLNMLVFEDHDKEDLPGEDAKLPQPGASYATRGGESKKVLETFSWRQRRQAMQEVCTQCHAATFVGAFYEQFDGAVALYNEKFAVPGNAIIEELRARGIITRVDFDEPIEWTWWELWHHEGRRGRHGAAMMGPDYAWWHGVYEVAKHFYEEFIPRLKEVAGEQVAAELLEKHVYSQEGHRWHRDGISPEVIQRIRDFYRERYKQ